MSSSAVTPRRLRIASAAAVLALVPLFAAGTVAHAQQGQPGRADAGPPPAVVTGRIVGPDKKPLEEADVRLDESRSVATDRKGRFEFDPTAPGMHDVLVRKLGYVPVRFRVAVTAGDLWDGTIMLERSAQALPPVVVLDSSKALHNFRPRWIDDFVARRRQGMGTFLDRVDIENAAETTTAQLLARAPGITTRSQAFYDALQVNRCGGGFGAGNKGLVYVDGFRTEVSTTGRFVSFHDYSPSDLAAIEIFRGYSEIPAQYAEPSACLVVLLWTNRR